MRKKYLSALLFGALLFASAGTFTSCKDYDDDIQNLQEQINTISTTLADLEAQIGQTGVSSVTFDEATGVLTVVDAEGTHTYTVQTSAGSGDVTEITIELDGQNLVVNGEVIGQVGDTVAVDDNGELTINGEATGITVGQYAILENDADNMYTITLPDANGELQTIQLPRASSTITVTINDPDNNTFQEVEGTANPDGINWGEAVADVDWQGPKGAVTQGQLLVGQINTVEVTVRPVSYDLSAQTLQLVDSEGNYANVNITATPAGSTAPVNSGSRASDSKGIWDLSIEMTDAVTTDNIDDTFATTENNIAANLKYALVVNGAIVTDYNYIIDTDTEATEGTDAAPAYEKDWTKIYLGDTAGSSATDPTFTMALGSSEVTVKDANAYDIHVSIAPEDENDAEAIGVTIADNVITAPDSAAGEKIHFVVEVIGVDGRVVEYNSQMAVTFGQTTVDAGEIEATTYAVSATATTLDDIVIDLGNTFSSLTAAQAVSLTDTEWEINCDNFLLADGTLNQNNVTYSSDAEGENIVDFDDTEANIRNIRYAHIPVRAINSEAKPGDYTLTLTLTSETGEVKKVNVPVTVTIPTFDELFTKSAAWDNDVVTLRLNGTGEAQMMTAYSTRVDLSTNPLTVTFGKINNNSVVNDDKDTFSTTTETFQITSAAIDNTTHTLRTVTAESSYKVQGIDGFEVKSGEYTIQFISPLDGANIVYYVNGTATSLSVNGADATFNEFVAAVGNTPKSGLAIVANTNDYVLVGSTINALTLTAASWNEAFDSLAGDRVSVNINDEGALVITGLAASTSAYDTNLTLTYVGAVSVGGSTVNTSFTVPVHVVNQ